MAGCKYLWLSKFLHILLHFATDLAARIDGTTIGGVAGVYITYHGCNRKTPMVKLVTINKNFREIAQIKKKSFYQTNKKQEHFLWIVCTFGYFCR